MADAENADTAPAEATQATAAAEEAQAAAVEEGAAPIDGVPAEAPAEVTPAEAAPTEGITDEKTEQQAPKVKCYSCQTLCFSSSLFPHSNSIVKLISPHRLLM